MCYEGPDAPLVPAQDKEKESDATGEEGEPEHDRPGAARGRGGELGAGGRGGDGGRHEPGGHEPKTEKNENRGHKRKD